MVSGSIYTHVNHPGTQRSQQLKQKGRNSQNRTLRTFSKGLSSFCGAGPVCRPCLWCSAWKWQSALPDVLPTTESILAGAKFFPPVASHMTYSGCKLWACTAGMHLWMIAGVRNALTTCTSGLQSKHWNNLFNSRLSSTQSHITGMALRLKRRGEL